MSCPVKGAAEIPVTSNTILLSVWEWLGVGLFVLLIYLVIPSLWRQVEPFEPESDYRIPYALSGDYWLFDRYARLAVSAHDTLIIGNRTQQRQLKPQVPLGHLGKPVMNATDIGGSADPVDDQEHRTAECVQPQYLQ